MIIIILLRDFIVNIGQLDPTSFYFNKQMQTPAMATGMVRGKVESKNFNL